MVPDDGAPAALIYADAFYQPGEFGRPLPGGGAGDAGHRGQNGWGYVVAPDLILRQWHGPSGVPRPLHCEEGHVLEMLARMLALVVVTEVAGVHRQRRWPVGPGE